MIYKYFRNKLGLWVDYVWFISILEIKVGFKSSSKNPWFWVVGLHL